MNSTTALKSYVSHFLYFLIVFTFSSCTNKEINLSSCTNKLKGANTQIRQSYVYEGTSKNVYTLKVRESNYLEKLIEKTGNAWGQKIFYYQLFFDLYSKCGGDQYDEIEIQIIDKENIDRKVISKEIMKQVVLATSAFEGFLDSFIKNQPSSVKVINSHTIGGEVIKLRNKTLTETRNSIKKLGKIERYELIHFKYRPESEKIDEYFISEVQLSYKVKIGDQIEYLHAFLVEDKNDIDLNYQQISGIFCETQLPKLTK